MISDKFNKISDAIIKLDEKIGFKRILGYALIAIVIFCVFNFKSIAKGVVEFVQELNEEIHTEKMEKRDELLRELSPILLELRTSTGADRVLYFEYHNSKENLVGIPFKYVDLVLQNTKYGIPNSIESNFRDINVGSITPLYEATLSGDVIMSKGPGDTQFQRSYPGTYELFSCDSSKIQAFVEIPGIDQPIGMIVLEWVDVDDCLYSEENLENIIYNKENNYISRINGLILSKR